jgi:Protein of unknown function (DUF2905)
VARFIIILVLAAVAVGLIWPILVRLRRGRVPNGVAVRRGRRSYFVPIAACVALSFLISAALWWFAR